MDNWSALFDGQTRYVLDINDSTVKADVLRFRGREALSEPFRWDIEFTSLHANIPPEQVLMKYASLRMRGGKKLLLSLYNVSAHNVYYVKYAGFVVKFMRTSLSGTYRRISRLLKFSCGFTITS